MALAYRCEDLLILDEATSDLDTGIERRVHRAIEGMDRDYAIVAIAHRLSTVRGADRIYHPLGPSGQQVQQSV